MTFAQMILTLTVGATFASVFWADDNQPLAMGFCVAFAVASLLLIKITPEA